METISEKKKRKKTKFWIPAILLVLVMFVLVVMFINAKKPDRITLGKLDSHVKGAAFIKTNQVLIEQMYSNWLPNDIFWPTVFLDNMPNFQMGQLEVVRYNVRVLRDNLSRMRTTDKLDPSAEGAFTGLANDPYKWWFPSAENKWKMAHKNLGIFYQDLLEGKSHFYPRADNLVELLKQYASLMGGVNTRLINAPRDMDEVLTMDEGTKDNSKTPKMINIDIPWYQIDDNFYYSQGVAYALYESLKAIRIDFFDVLTDKNSVKLIDKILENLRRCYFEPLIVFNGDPGSIFANHSLNLSGMFNDARQKVES
ncbi:MAG: DUF2333 family protein, partial [Desulfobacterales bacterium]|nr:DUF2333 family protein [Desulfobacterales bacterium]